MSTLTDKSTEHVRAETVRFSGNNLHVGLSDGREVCLAVTGVPWLRWLAKASPRQRANWSIEPGGYAIYWHDLDDGIEVCHLLSIQPVA